MAARLVEAKVAKHLYISQGMVRALEHVTRLEDDAVAVDFLNGVSGIGFPRWPEHTDLTWCAVLCPLLCKLLQSSFEE
jgi:hypothetical protein